MNNIENADGFRNLKRKMNNVVSLITLMKYVKIENVWMNTLTIKVKKSAPNQR